MRILMVGPYPPARDGIAAYTVQAVARLRAEGHDVEVLSPWPSAAHHHLDLRGWRGPLALARRSRAYDKVILQFHPDLFYPQPFDDRQWAAISLALAVAFRTAPDIEIRVHETDYSRGPGDDVLSRAVRIMWQASRRVVVHTEVERQSFHRAFGVPLDRIEVVDHGAHFTRWTTADRAQARAGLGIPDDELMFLSIGFIQPHKGFDRALRAFAALGRADARLDVVGSVRVDEPGCREHLEELRSLAEATPGASLHTGYVSDEAFDRWLVAADVVVLPYRHIWSSGVVERAALYDRPVILTRVGGLEAQARPGTVVVDTDEDLADAMSEVAGVARAGRKQWTFETPVDRDTVMGEIRTRAAAQHVPNGSAPFSPSGNELPARRLNRLTLPPAISARPGATLAKRLLRRLTAWQLEPVVRHVNLLQDATVRTTESLDARLDEVARRDKGPSGPTERRAESRGRRP